MDIMRRMVKAVRGLFGQGRDLSMQDKLMVPKQSFASVFEAPLDSSVRRGEPVYMDNCGYVSPVSYGIAHSHAEPGQSVLVHIAERDLRDARTWASLGIDYDKEMEARKHEEGLVAASPKELIYTRLQALPSSSKPDFSECEHKGKSRFYCRGCPELDLCKR